jgi:methyltransferase (TIGR00027 family)
MLRAAHQLFDGMPRIVDDTAVVALLGPKIISHVRERERSYREPVALALRSHVLLRSRFAEERLREAVGRGVTQFVLLGAGLDTFAYRQPAWARALSIVEVDHPASQSAKRERLAAATIALPPNLMFAPIDFERDTLLAGLVRAGFDPRAMTFISCLGVLVYLTGQAITDLFAFIARLPAGSECVFTFGGTKGPDHHGRPSLATMAAALGEPWRSNLELDDVRAVMARAGLPAPRLLSVDEAARYLGDRRDGLRWPKRDRIASVVVDASRLSSGLVARFGGR